VIAVSGTFHLARNESLLLLLLFLLLFPLSIFSEDEWFPEQLKNLIKPCQWEKRNLGTEFHTSVEVSAESTYPRLYGDGLLIEHVNKKLEGLANKVFKDFVDHEKHTQEEHNDDFGGCYLSYHLFPVQCLPNLISIYGFEFQHRACPHGWTHYEGRNFWQNKDTIVEISLSDLFLKKSDWCNFLLQYCVHHFKSTRYGYYASDDGYIPELEPEDLEIFVLSERELVIIFRSYRVGGWADGPDVIAIPYYKLKEFINPKGPLKELPVIISLF